MKSKTNMLEKARVLSDSYQKMNNEGRNILDKTINELGRMNNEYQKVKELVLNGLNDLTSLPLENQEN